MTSFRGSNPFLCVLASLSVSFAIVSGISAQAPAGAAAAKALKNPVKTVPESLAAGKQVYTKYCGFCHGLDAKGEGPMAPKDTHPPNLTDATWTHGSTDGEIFTIIQDGIGPKFDMKPNKGKIKEQDIWHVVNYVRSLGAGKK